MDERYVDVLTKLSLLPWIDGQPESFKNLISMGSKKVFRKNATIIDQDDVSENIYYLHKGKVKVILFTTAGEDRLFWYASAGNIIGDVPFFHCLPSNAAIVAEEDCIVYCFSKTVFSEIIKNNPQFASYLLEAMAKKIRVLVNQLQDITFNDPTVRVSKFLYLLSQKFGQYCGSSSIELDLNLTHKEIASITGVHRVTVTNVFAKLKNQGIINKSKKGTLVILKPEMLYAYAFEDY
ncbi:CRP/FNR family transcriptional regulator [Desulfitispora alkaliphila]|uniref:Crp/Fnr family transcriptional regulator n=1 Tax=Desulfitispora alkaliphila TaxID=622674 RepID=UPI003D222068